MSDLVKSAHPKVASAERRYRDDTINGVYFNDYMFDVKIGSWRVYVGGEFERAEFIEVSSGDRWSIFIKHVIAVRHVRHTKRPPRKQKVRR